MNQDYNRTAAGFAVCDSCGEVLFATATFCPNCGSRKISKGVQQERELPFQDGMDYNDADYYTPVLSAHRYDAYVSNGDDQVYYGEDPAAEYEEEYEDAYEEDEYASAPMPSASSVRVFAVVGFLVAVIATALIGLMVSWLPHSDAPESEKQGKSGSASEISSAVSSALIPCR